VRGVLDRPDADAARGDTDRAVGGRGKAVSIRPDHAESDRLARLHELRFWLRGHGCCWSCALRLALVQVEKEAGLRFEPFKQCATDGGCGDKARSAWATMPGAARKAAA